MKGRVMKNINLEQTEFKDDEQLKKYISALIIEYTSIMNNIENDINKKSETYPQKDFFPEYSEKYFPIFKKYCTDKKRVYGGNADSYGDPTKFDGIENFTESNIEIKNANRIEAYFKTKNDFNAEYLFMGVSKNYTQT
jgi:hypothetical protein